MKVFVVVEVKGGMESGDRTMVEITDAVVISEYRRLYGDELLEPEAVTLTLAEWVIEP